MEKTRVLSRIRELGLVAVLRGPSKDLTIKIVEALVQGGILGIEITFTTPGAVIVVEELSQIFGDKILLGMGTVTSVSQVEEAVDAGAEFLVSPHYNSELAEQMSLTGLLTMFGAFTPTEIFQARAFGADIVKLFPGSLGGPKYLKAIRAPFPEIPILPTGGVNLENLVDWFDAGAIAVGAGSSLCPGNWAIEGRFHEITANAVAFQDALTRSRMNID